MQTRVMTCMLQSQRNGMRCVWPYDVDACKVGYMHGVGVIYRHAAAVDRRVVTA